MSLARNIEYYKDKECTDPIKEDNTGKPLIKIPKVVLDGEKTTETVYIVNRSNYEFQIGGVSNPDADVKLEIEDDTLYPNKPVKVDITFSPKIGRKEVLNTQFSIKGRFVIRR